MDNLIYGGLVVISANDSNYKRILHRASQEQIKEAIEVMKNRNGKDKARIIACQREIKRRIKQGIEEE